MKPNLLPFIAEKWAGVPKPTKSFAGKNIIVTGANVGLGFETALKFVTLQADRVILGVRSLSKGTAACQRIEASADRKGVAEAWELDMDSYSSIQEFASRASHEMSHLDVVILNAGISPKTYVRGAEGWESTLQVNVMGTALLGLLLLPKMKASKTSSNQQENGLPHLTIVTSEAHRWLEDKDLPDPAAYGGNLLEAVSAEPVTGKRWDGMLQNARTKLFGMYITRALAQLSTKPSGEVQVIVTSVCPGACKSELVRDFKSAGFGYAFALKIFDLLFNKPTEEGARAYVAAASLGEEAQGRWYKTTALAT